MFIAQAAPTTHEVWTVLLAFGVVAAILGNVAQLIIARRKREHVAIDHQPVEISGAVNAEIKTKQFSYDLCQASHLTIDRRLNTHEAQIDKLWFTMRNEDAAIRASLEVAIRDFDKTINRIDGTLAAVEKTNNMILKQLLDRA